MTYPKAHAGVKKVFISELFQIIGGVLAVLAATFALINLGPFAVAGGTVALVAVGLEIAAFILEMVGLWQAGKDADQFMIAFWIIIISIALNVSVVLVNQFAPSVPLVSSLLTALSNASSVIVTIYIIFGIVELSDKLHEPRMETKGRRLAYMVALLYVVSILLSIIPSFFKIKGELPQPLVITFGVFGIISAVMEVVTYVLIFFYLLSAVRMLRK